MNDAGRNPGNRRLLSKLLLLAVAMFGFGFLLVPLYDVFCDITGIGDRTGLPTADAVQSQTPVEDRTVTVEFVANLNEYAPWEFRPAVASMKVHPGKLYNTTFFARNLTNQELIGQAVPSYAPAEVSKYFKKTECFCFTTQDFKPQEGRDMGLQFMVDPDLPEYLDRITLSYTFFVKQQVAHEPGATR
ncbi:MAG TPA: cytochrome c oxidase assembly protein [Chromatiales bacterium]|nr:cytochrome c oxidase assembly protein [Chromatiales bacterium]